MLTAPPPALTGSDPPRIVARPPGPQTRTWLLRAGRVAAPMGPTRKAEERASLRGGVLTDVPRGSIVYATAKGANVVDVDGNRFVDLAGGFGAMLLGHAHPSILRVIELASTRLLQALGDVHPSDAKIALSERLTALFPEKDAKVILGQSGADAVTAALESCVLATGRSGVVAFRGAYHGLSYAPLAACGLRDSYRAPFARQLNEHVTFAQYPGSATELERTFSDVEDALRGGDVGAILVEPILGRGGCVVPPPGFLPGLLELAHAHGALLVADEIWTGLGRAGSMLQATDEGVVPDVLCLGKGLGGGLPISACIGKDSVMRAWRRDAEVVQTSTFAGAPLACATAIATLDTLSRDGLCARSRDVGNRFRAELAEALSRSPANVQVRGDGLMIGVDLGGGPGSASIAAQRLLERGYIASTGGGGREVLVLTPPLNISEPLLLGAISELAAVLDGPSA